MKQTNTPLLSMTSNSTTCPEDLFNAVHLSRDKQPAISFDINAINSIPLSHLVVQTNAGKEI